METVSFTLVFAALLAISTPIYAAVGIMAIVSVWALGVPLTMLPQIIYTGTDVFPLLAVPLFVLAGYLMEYGGATDHIVKLMLLIFGRLRGGLGMVTIFSSAFFAAVSGSGPGTVAAVAPTMIPAMKKNDYPLETAAAIAATGGTLGILIPPSNPMIVYGVVGNVSIASLFLAGFIPGLILALILCVTIYFMSLFSGFGKRAEVVIGGGLLQCLWHGKWALLMPFVVLGGIYSGAFTPVEASVIAADYALFLGLFVTRKLTLKSILLALQETCLVSGALLVIIGTSTLFGQAMTLHHVPQRVAESLVTISADPHIVLLVIVALFLFLGMFLETLSTIMILTPILLPPLVSMGVHPIHFGIIFVMTNEIAFLTPPLGINLFVVMSLTGLSLEAVSKASLIFIIVLTACTVLFVYYPEPIMILPQIFHNVVWK